MAFIITSACIKDELCVDVCPTDCIHPKKDEPAFEEVQQLFVDLKNALIAAPACRYARRTRSTTRKKFRKICGRLSPPMPLITGVDSWPEARSPARRDQRGVRVRGAITSSAPVPSPAPAWCLP